MKKWISSVLCFAIVVAMTGCANGQRGGARVGKSTSGVNDVLRQGMSSAEEAYSTASSESETSESVTESTMEATKNPDGSDLDLTVLSSTMVYTEVFCMVNYPDEYIGKTVKMSGAFAYYHDEATNKNYYACIIQDATACCSQGMEFVLKDGYSYPEDYPNVGEEVCVTGVFSTYTEDGKTYCTLRDADMTR